MEYKNQKFQPSGREGTTVVIQRDPPEDSSRIAITQKQDAKYRFRRTIGQGGMKRVLQVYDTDTMRDVAMALMITDKDGSEQTSAQFIHEARITASLEHPNIVPVHDIGIDSAGVPYFTMKLLSGQTLASLLKKIAAGDRELAHRYSFDQLMRIFLRICNGIAFAHSKDILHLDLKPQNIQIGDYGEVLVLDWGLARKIYEHDSAVSREEGIMKGTPGYMAPEQIHGKKTELDFRTDVYALGAVLYAMVTGMNPLEQKELPEMLKDAVEGNIIRPGLRAPEKEIPFGIEAVIMKAMNLNPAERYQSVSELRNDVLAFVDGFATKAEKAGFWKKGLLFYRRHKIPAITGTIIFILLVFFGIYFTGEISKSQSGWIQVYSGNFRSAEASYDQLTFHDALLTSEVTSWETTSQGLCMKTGQWLKFNLPLQDGVKMILKVEVPQNSKGSLEVCLNCKNMQLQETWQSPAGYSFRIGGQKDSKSTIVRTASISSPEVLNAAFTSSDDEMLEIEAEHSGETLSVRIGKNPTVTVYDYFPLTGKNYNTVFLRARGENFVIREMKLYRLAPAEKTTPMIAGDTLLEAGMYELAVEKYLVVADSFRTPLGEHALFKAYVTAAEKMKHGPKRDEQLIGIKRRIAENYPKFRYRSQILETDACVAWASEEYSLALELIQKTLTANPDSSVISRILQLPHKPLSQQTAHDFCTLIRSSRQIKHLNLSSFGLTSLSPLSGMNLVSLDCSGNKLHSLEGLEGMQLESLSCANNQLTSLHELAGMPLRYLDCSRNSISGILPLTGLPLERLCIRDNQIVSLEPLADTTTLLILDIGNNPVSSLQPVSNILPGLFYLHMDGTNISEPAPLTSGNEEETLRHEFL